MDAAGHRGCHCGALGAAAEHKSPVQDINGALAAMSQGCTAGSSLHRRTAAVFLASESFCSLSEPAHLCCFRSAWNGMHSCTTSFRAQVWLHCCCCCWCSPPLWPCRGQCALCACRKHCECMSSFKGCTPGRFTTKKSCPGERLGLNPTRAWRSTWTNQGLVLSHVCMSQKPQ